ncbi:MAG: hypothetical protein AAFO81_09655 [Pseudomonadota bacterium]
MTQTNDGFSIFDLWAACRNHFFAFGVSGLIVLAVFVTYAIVAKPVYRVQVVMLPTDDFAVSGSESGLGGISSSLGLLAGLVPGGSRSVEAIATLESSAFLERFVVKHELLPILYSDLWDASSGSWRSDVEQSDIPDVSDAIEYFREDCLSLDEQTATKLTTLTIEWKEPTTAASWANAIVADLNAELQAREIAESESMISYLQAELESTTIIGLQQSIFRLLEQQVQSKAFARVRAEYAFRVIDPAVAPDVDDYIRPNRIVIVLTGLFGGLIVGVSLSLLLTHLGALRQSA